MEGFVCLVKTGVIPVLTFQLVFLVFLENTSKYLKFVFPVSTPVLSVQPKTFVVPVQTVIMYKAINVWLANPPVSIVLISINAYHVQAITP